MNNAELQELVRQVGLQNDVAIPADDLQRLLDRSFQYDFLAKFVKDVAKIEKVSLEELRKLQADHESMIEDVREQKYPGGLISGEIMGWLLWLLAKVDDAKNLMLIHPGPSWDEDSDNA